MRRDLGSELLAERVFPCFSKEEDGVSLVDIKSEGYQASLHEIGNQQIEE